MTISNENNNNSSSNAPAPLTVGDAPFLQRLRTLWPTKIMKADGPVFSRWPFTVYKTYRARTDKTARCEPAVSNVQPTSNHPIDPRLTNRARRRGNNSTSAPSPVPPVPLEKKGHHIRERNLAPYYLANYQKVETFGEGQEAAITKHYYFRIGWFFWFMDRLSLMLGREFVLCQPLTRTGRALVADAHVDDATFVKVEVTANNSAIDPPIVPKTATGGQAYPEEKSTKERVEWFIRQCRMQNAMNWDEGCMYIDTRGRIQRVTPCRCGGMHHRQIQLLIGISMLFPLYMARFFPRGVNGQQDLPPDISDLVKAVDSIHDDTEDDVALQEAIKQIYDDENNQRRKGNTKKCAASQAVYSRTLKSIVTDPELNDSDFFVARWRFSPDDKSSTQSLIKATRKSTDRRDKISVIYLLLTYRGLYPADSIALLGRSISTELLDDILEKLDVQTMRFPVDGYEATKQCLAKDMNPWMTDCGAYDTYFDVIGSQRVLVSLSSTVRRTDQYLELWQSFSVKGVPYSDRLEGIIITVAILIFNLSPLFWMRHSTTILDYYINVADQGSYFIAATALLVAVATSWRSHGHAFHDMIVGKKHSTKLSHLLRKRSMYDMIPFFLKMVAHYEGEHAPFLSRKYNSYMLPGKKGDFELDCVFTIKDLVDAGYKVLQTSDRKRSDHSVDQFLWVDFKRSPEARDFELCKEGRRMIVKDGVIRVSTKETALRHHMATSYADIIVG